MQAGGTLELRDPRGGGLLDRSGLIAALELDQPGSDAFLRIARLAGAGVGAPMAAVTFLGDGRHHNAAQVGFAEAVDSVPTSHSLCAHAVASGQPLVLEDTRSSFAEHPAVGVHGVGAYLGVPIRTASGEVVGAVCAMAPEARGWSAADVAALTDAAVLAAGVVEARASAATSAELAVAQAVSAQVERRTRGELADRLHDRVLQTLLAVGQDLTELAGEDGAEAEGPRRETYRALRELGSVLRELHPALFAGADLNHALLFLAGQRRRSEDTRVQIDVGPETRGLRSPLLFDAAHLLLREIPNDPGLAVVVSLRSRPVSLVLELRLRGALDADGVPPARGALLTRLAQQIEGSGGRCTRHEEPDGWRVVVEVPRAPR